MASWPGTLHCDNPTPLEGSTVEVSQRLAVRVRNGRASGPTRIVIEFTSAGIRREYQGRVRGDVACAVGVCTLDLETDANGPRGSHLRGSALVDVDAETHEVLSFNAGTLEDTTIGQ